MDTAEFLRRVWPDQGIFCLAAPNPITKGWRHETVESIEDALTWIDRHKTTTDIYFAMHTLKAKQYIHPTKNTTHVRPHANMKECRCFFMEIDVGDSDKKYPNQLEAAAALKQFCAETKLPTPTVNSSGGGLHIFWFLDTPLKTSDWLVHAFKLFQLTIHHGLKIDRTKINDQSAVLRVPGTFHRKDPTNPKEVRVLKPGPVTPLPKFLTLLHDAHVRTGMAPKMMPTSHVEASADQDEQLVSDDVVVASQVIDESLAIPALTAEGEQRLLAQKYGPPVPVQLVLDSCAQIKRIADLKGNVPEPEWFHALIGVVKFAENGRDWIHTLSSGHPTYTREETDDKIDRWTVGVTSCEKIAEICSNDLCAQCPAFKTFRSNPLKVARLSHTAATPIDRYLIGSTEIAAKLLDPPKPYRRLEGGGVVMVDVDKNNEEFHIQIIPPQYDLYPKRREHNEEAKTEHTVWGVISPLDNGREMVLDAETLRDNRKLMAALANHGIYLSPGQEKEANTFMIAYIQELQRQMRAEAQVTHLGWHETEEVFMLPDRIIHNDGSAGRAVIASSVKSTMKPVHAKGEMKRQVELMEFYNNPVYVASQFLILCSLATPLMRFTNQAGLIINASGTSGASKSTTLYAAASMWGNPVTYCLSGTQSGSTELARDNRLQILCNLPLCVDEITHMDPKRAQNLAMQVSQAVPRAALTQKRVERKEPSERRSTMMLCTSNSSLHEVLSNRNQAGNAGSMRVFEIEFKPQNVHTKAQADEFARELNNHYGHIGPVMAAYYTQHLNEVRDRTIAAMEEFDRETNIVGAERFWSSAAATTTVANEISRKLGLLSFDPVVLRHWMTRVQLPMMRGVVAEEYVEPLQVVINFLASCQDQLLVTQGANVMLAPRNGLAAHIDKKANKIIIQNDALAMYCKQVGASAKRVREALSAPGGPMINKRVRITMGKDTHHSVGQMWCCVLDGAHPDINLKGQNMEAQLESVMNKAAAT